MCSKDLCQSTLLGDMSTDMSTEYRPICQSTYQPILRRHVGRLSVDISVASVGRHSADMLQLAVGGVSVNCWWYRSIVYCCFAEIAAISLPTGEQKNTHKKYAQDYRIQRKSCIEKV